MGRLSEMVYFLNTRDGTKKVCSKVNSFDPRMIDIARKAHYRRLLRGKDTGVKVLHNPNEPICKNKDDRYGNSRTYSRKGYER